MRPTLDEMFMEIAETVSKRATCPRANVGCVVAKDDHIVSCGYNGAPPKQEHCVDVGCDQTDGEGCRRAVHAEANAIAFAAKKGISLEGATIYNTYGPCDRCARLCVSAGITRFVYRDVYRAEDLQVLERAGVEVERFQTDNRN